jgi:hypothetical protein
LDRAEIGHVNDGVNAAVASYIEAEQLIAIDESLSENASDQAGSACQNDARSAPISYPQTTDWAD